ncbi:MAG: RusA family crossover junction endodeoxyribonuclease [Chitinophagia bacterium]
MLFELEYDEQIFLVDLDHLDREKTKKAEVFALRYNNNPNDDDEYEIKMFAVKGEDVTPIKVLDLPKELLDVMGEDLKKAMPKTFFANPYFDELMIFFGSTVLTSKDRFAMLSCTQCGRKNLYEKKGKENKSDYTADIQKKLHSNPNPAWPFKGRLHVQFSVSDKQGRLNKIDLDNLAKAILDSLKGIVFEDDAQIDTLVATKDYTNDMVANMVAIKELQLDERGKVQEFLFSGKFKSWRKEYKMKEAEGKPTRFIRF